MKFTKEQMKKIESVVFFDISGKMCVKHVEGYVLGDRIKELEARLAAQERIAETPVGETFIDTISDFAWADPYGPMFIALGKLKERET